MAQSYGHLKMLALIRSRRWYSIWKFRNLVLVKARVSRPNKQREAKTSSIWPSHDTHQTSAPNYLKPSSYG